MKRSVNKSIVFFLYWKPQKWSSGTTCLIPTNISLLLWDTLTVLTGACRWRIITMSFSDIHTRTVTAEWTGGTRLPRLPTTPNSICVSYKKYMNIIEKYQSQWHFSKTCVSFRFILYSRSSHHLDVYLTIYYVTHRQPTKNNHQQKAWDRLHSPEPNWQAYLIVLVEEQ